jgi:hypothetical protein
MLQNLRRFRTHVAGIGVAAAIVAVAGATSLDGSIMIVAPTEVYAGNPICGYVTGNHGMTVVQGGVGSANGNTFLGAVSGIADPLLFIFPTFEPMAPGVATIRATDSEDTETANVILK